MSWAGKRRLAQNAVAIAFLLSPWSSWAVRADAAKASSMARVSEEVNQKMVKLFGSGGYKGISAYGTGIVISPDGFILTVATPMLDTSELLVHLSDGRRMKA